MEITQARLKELFSYDPETGHFTRLIKVSNQHPGDIAGAVNSGYVLLRVDGERCMAHRAAWLYMTGEWPKNEIDHINRNGFDNRWQNLRPATAQQNMANRPGNSGKSGVKGVYWDGRKSRWYTQLRCDGKVYYAGSYPNLDQAKAAIQAKRIEIHKNYACND